MSAVPISVRRPIIEAGDLPGVYLPATISRQRVYEMCAQGLIPHVRIGRRIYFDPAALEKWLEQGGSSFAGGWRRQPEQ